MPNRINFLHTGFRSSFSIQKSIAGTILNFYSAAEAPHEC